MDNFSVLTYHAAFLIWNYSDRRGSNKVSSASEVDQQIISTLSLKSISTSKTKTASHGTFEVRLAPTKNWVNVLTSGSWCTILMSRDKIERQDIDSNNPNVKADPNKVKLFGRIDSVRAVTSVDQNSGARVTEYVVTGTDWGSIFNSTLYVDPALAWDAKNKDTPIGFVSQLIYKQALNAQLANIPSTAENLKVLLKLWGSKADDLGKTPGAVEKDGLVLKPEIKFTIPTEVVKFFGFTNKRGETLSSTALADLIQLYHGRLKKLNSSAPYRDSYDSVKESFGIIHGEDVLNQHEMWSVIGSLGNSTINEVICDLRWDNDRPSLGLYKRIKPFILSKKRLKRDKQEVGDEKGAIDSSLDTYISEFKNIRRIEIPLKEVVSYNGGTNWRDKVNFIEIKPSDPLFLSGVAPEIRFGAQFYDKESFAREGLKPYIASVRYYPKATIEAAHKNIESSIEKNKQKKEKKKEVNKSKGETSKKNSEKSTFGKNIEAIIEWKYILKEWYFDTHRMLNGSVSFAGQDKYIQVGDNIIIDARVTGFAENTTFDQINNRGKAFLLAHVEAISHSFTVSENGARHFTSNVNFVRGIIVDESGNKLSGEEQKNNKVIEFGQLEQDATKTRVIDEVNHANVAVKTEMDPD